VVLAGMFLMMLLTLGGGGWAMWTQQKATAARLERQRADSLARAAVADSLSRGSKLVVGLPDDVEATIDGRPFRNGERFTADTGRYIATATKPGYQDWRQTVVIESGKHDTLQVAMVLATLAPTPITRPGPQVAVVRDSSQVRFNVFPLHAQILVNGNVIGQGRIQRWLPLGQHRVRYFLQGCAAQEETINVEKGPPQTLPQVRLTGGSCG
jgi:hypothetical protein